MEESSPCVFQSSSTWRKKVGSREGRWGQKEESDGQGWNTNGSSWGAKSGDLTVQTEQGQDNRSAGGEKRSWEVRTPDISSVWGTSSKWGKVSSSSPVGVKKGLWNSPKKNVSRWGSRKFDNVDSSQHVQGWGRGRGGGDWGSGRGRGGRGQGAGDWKNNRSPRRAYDPNKPSILTMTWQRLDMFSAELQDVLKETEAIMKNIRRIMSLKEYSDGDPLPQKDQKYIIENVFNYHPEKAVKTGAGLDYITVNKHKEFQESRCFHVVSIDGNTEDFSYYKCLENFVKQKYPEKAEEFIPMYFKRRQPRGEWNKEQGPGTPRMSSPVGWNKEPGPRTPRMSSQ